jgi:acyl-[acyl-carrier-protein] desaturase
LYQNIKNGMAKTSNTPDWCKDKRREVMQSMEIFVDNYLEGFQKSPEQNWQPTDFLPDASNYELFIEDVRKLQLRAKELPPEVMVILVGDAVTEEALPTYESQIFTNEGLNYTEDNAWNRWTRLWTAEENRHGDLLNKYLYLCGRVNMRSVEQTIQHLITDGFDIKTQNDPYRTFVYTSFQEIATQISHNRVGSLSKKAGENALAKMCGLIAADESRHAKAYQSFIAKIFEADPSEMMLAFADMMRQKIVMPAHFLREVSSQAKGDSFSHFSDAAQRLGVYTAADYVDIIQQLVERWDIGHHLALTSEAQKAQDYLMLLPNRLKRVAERLKTPELATHQFSWVY